MNIKKELIEALPYMIMILVGGIAVYNFGIWVIKTFY